MNLRPQVIRQDDEESREAASWGTVMLFESREKRILSHFISLSLSLSPPELALPLSLSRSLEDHMWNHLISQKTKQSDEEDECNARSAKSGERRGEGEENIENNVQACNLKSSAQKVSQHRLRDLNLEAQIVPKCLPKGPSETLWTHLGQPLGA